MAVTDTQGSGSAQVSVGGGLNSQLVDMLMNGEIQPGDSIGYSLAKTIYSYHPLGAKLAEAPITMAQSQTRDIEIPVLGQEILLDAFNREWDEVNGIGASPTIHNFVKTARIYGISAMVVGERGIDPSEPLDLDQIGKSDIYFNILDPLNTSGSLIMNQDPNAPDFLKPNHLRVGSQTYHPSRSCIMMNEQPIYLEWSTSAFGFVGRSVYQRALYPLRTFVQSMVTDQMVTQKAGLLIAKMKSPGNIISNAMTAMFGWKASNLKAGVTGQVLTVGIDEAIEALDMKNLEAPARFARENMLKNIASAAGMPASMVNNETLASGFGEGSEDAKNIARFIDAFRIEMAPAYRFMDRIVQRRAWTPAFFETMQRLHPAAYGGMTYDAAFFLWRTRFRAVWPNLLTEPDSELIKVDETRMKSVVAMGEIMMPYMDPENKAEMLLWMAECANDQERLFPSKLLLDEDKLRSYTPPKPPESPRMPLAFESET